MKSIYKDRILKLANDGKTFDQIVNELGCSKQLVRYFLVPGTNKSMMDRCLKRKKDINIILKNIHGSKCQKCGYNKCLNALDFHHVDPKTKKHAIHDLANKSKIKEAREEANKCILLCSNCHREYHSGLIKLDGLVPFVDIIREEDTLSSLQKSYDIG